MGTTSEIEKKLEVCCASVNFVTLVIVLRLCKKMGNTHIWDKEASDL